MGDVCLFVVMVFHRIQRAMYRTRTRVRAKVNAWQQTGNSLGYGSERIMKEQSSPPDKCFTLLKDS